MSISCRSTGGLSATDSRAGADGTRNSRPSSPSSRKPSPHTRSNWRRPPSNCGSSSGRCSANVASGMHPRPIRSCFSCPKPSKGWMPSRRPPQDANADSPPPRTRRKPRRPRIEFPQFWEHRRIEYPLPPEELPCGCCGAAADHHPHPRHEAGGDGRGEAVRGRRGAVHLRLFRTATTARRCRPRRGRRRPWRRAPSGRASWLGW